MDEERRHGFMWLRLESSLWKCMNHHVTPKTYTLVSLEENQMRLQIIDGKTQRYVISMSFFLVMVHACDKTLKPSIFQWFVSLILKMPDSAIIYPILFTQLRRFTRKLSNGWKRVKANTYWRKLPIQCLVRLSDLHLLQIYSIYIWWLLWFYWWNEKMIDKKMKYHRILSYVK